MWIFEGVRTSGYCQALTNSMVYAGSSEGVSIFVKKQVNTFIKEDW